MWARMSSHSLYCMHVERDTQYLYHVCMDDAQVLHALYHMLYAYG